VVPIRPFRRQWPTGLVLVGLMLSAACSAGGSTLGLAGASTATASPATTPPTTAVASAPPATSPPAATPTSAPPQGSACVRTAFDQLTDAQRAAQLVMSGVPAGNPAAQRALVQANHLGAVFLAGRSSHSPSTIHASLARLAVQRTKSAKIGLLVGVDQEGGKVQTLHGSAWTTIPAATVQGGWSTSTLTSRTRTWVGQLKRAGITIDLAPVADTVPSGTASKNPPIGAFDRQYGSTPARVSGAVATVTSTMKATGITPTVKHFPGLGRVRANTDTSTKAVDSITTADDPYLQPFAAGIHAGAGAVMISSASYPKLDADHLAVFSSKVITGLLRQKMGYTGVVMTDDVGKAVAVKSVPVGQRATRFIAAGGDLVLTVLPARAHAMVMAILTQSRSDARFRAQMNASVQRVLRLKQQSGLLTCS
jgi:beta-N-acetylhexosaminidase